MDVNKLREWAKQMGYQGKIPDDFKHVLNASTVHIWQQVVARVRPRDELEKIRQNIVVHKLQKQQNNTTLTKIIVDCPNRDENVWLEKRQAEEALEKIKIQIREARKEMKHLETEGNILIGEIQHLDSQMQESRSHEYLLGKKHIGLTKDVAELKQTKQLEITQLALITGSNRANLHQNVSELDDVESLYAANQRADLWQRIRSKEDGLMNEITRTIGEEITSRKDIEGELATLNEANLSKLHMVHIENELEAIKLSRQHEKLHQQFVHKGIQVINKWKTTMPDFQHMLQEEMQMMAIRAALRVCDAETAKLNEPIGVTRSNNEHKAQLRQARHCLAEKCNSLTSHWENIMQIERKIEERRHEAEALFDSLANYTSRNATIAKPLLKGVFAREVRLWEQINLEYNRQLVYSRAGNEDCERYYLDVAQRLPTAQDDTVWSNVVSALGVPITASYGLLHYFIDKRERYERLMRFACFYDEYEYKTYDLQELKEFESFNGRTMDELRAAAANTWTPLASQIKESLRLWEEIQFSNYLSDNVTYKGQGYKFYDELYMEYFSQLDFK